jgi:chromosome segregation protein
MIRPGPCLVLDEVDAPLDEVNLKRFHGLISKLSLRTQIILVTHHPLTMEIAQRIIGVTQRERGVSTLISYHLA